MPFTSAELSQLGNVSLDAYLRGQPIDQVAVQRPFLRRVLQGNGKQFSGGKQYVVEQVRFRYDSNFQFYFGAQTVTYKKKDTVRQAQWAWGGMHDGFYLSEDDLFANGIVINDQMPKSATKDERVQLTDLLEENLATLRFGFEEQWSLNMHQDGTQSAEAIAGLDHIIQLDPTAASTVGGIAQATNTYWQNNYATSIAGANLLATMETQQRKCMKHGGQLSFYLAGTTFIDTFRTQAASAITRYTRLQVSGEPVQYDPAVASGNMGVDTGLHFNGVPILWSPEFADLDDLLSPPTPWEKRCYGINSRHLRWRPARGHNMIVRRPSRQFDKYVWYWAITNKGVMSSNRRNAHTVIALA